MKKIITLLAIVFCLNTKAQYVTIPDANFVVCLQNIVPSAMNGNLLDTTNSLVTTTTHSISVINKSISNLSGIQYFTSLTYLNCEHNLISSLPALPNSIIYLDCSYNNFSSLPLLPNSLQTLWCFNNSLTSLPALPLSLQSLNCCYNSLISLPALPNSITYLNCCSNSLTSLPSLPTSLNGLACQVNSLTSLPPFPSSLQWMQCYTNNITCFPPFPNSMTGLDIDPNPYYCLPNYIPVMNAAQLATPICQLGNSNGCAVVTSGINHITDVNNQTSIYPNPANTSFTIETVNSDKQTLKVFDVNGKLVLSQVINGKTNVDVATLSEGIYNLSLINATGVVNKKLVIVR